MRAVTGNKLVWVGMAMGALAFVMQPVWGAVQDPAAPEFAEGVPSFNGTWEPKSDNPREKMRDVIGIEEPVVIRSIYDLLHESETP